MRENPDTKATAKEIAGQRTDLATNIFFGAIMVLAMSPLISFVPLIFYIACGFAVSLFVVGVILMLSQLRLLRDSGSLDLDAVLKGDLAYAVAELRQNYDILRKHTVQGFLLSSVLMGLGFIVIVVSLFGPSFGLPVQKTNLGAVVGAVLEFISGTSLLVYRLNFRRLNEVSDRLYESWRILAAHRLADALPEEKKTEARLRLIEALAQNTGGRTSA